MALNHSRVRIAFGTEPVLLAWPEQSEWSKDIDLRMWIDGKEVKGAETAPAVRDNVSRMITRFQTAMLIHQQRVIVQLLEQIVQYQSRIEARMATQADVDALTEAVTTLDDTINSDQAGIAAKFAELEAQIASSGASVDLSGLKGAIDKATGDVASVTALLPPAVTSAAGNVTTASTPDTGSTTDTTTASGAPVNTTGDTTQTG